MYDVKLKVNVEGDVRRKIKSEYGRQTGSKHISVRYCIVLKKT